MVEALVTVGLVALAFVIGFFSGYAKHARVQAEIDRLEAEEKAKTKEAVLLVQGKVNEVINVAQGAMTNLKRK